MADQNKPGGLFGVGIVPSGTRQEFGQELARMRAERSRADFAQTSRDPFAQQIHRAGTQLGLGLGAGRQMSDAQTRMFDVKEQGSQLFAQRRQEMGDDFNRLNAHSQRRIAMASMLEAAQEAGDVDTQMALGQAIQSDLNSERLNEAAILKAEGEAGAAQIDGDLNSPSRQLEIAGQLWTPSKVEEIRDTRAAFKKQLVTTDGIIDIFESLEDPQITQRAPGGILQFVNETAQTLGALGGEFTRYVTSDGSSFAMPTTAAAQDALSRSDSTFASALDRIKMPEGFVQDVNARAKYKAAVIRMAYAAWRQSEGSGSRQASDQDIINALDAIGANTGDFRVMLGTVMQHSFEGLEALEEQQRQVDNVASWGRLTPEFTDSFFGGSIQPHRDRFAAVRDRASAQIARFSPELAQETADLGAGAPDREQFESQGDFDNALLEFFLQGGQPAPAP